MKIISLIILSLLAAGCILAQNHDSAAIYFNKGTAEADAKHHLLASANFDKAINFDPKFTAAYTANGNVNLSMRKVDIALVNFIKANQLQPLNAAVIKELTYLYFNNRQFEKAIDMAQQCKECSDADRVIGMSYYHLEDYGKAGIALHKAVAKNPLDAEAAYTLSRNYVELEDEKNAIFYYEKAIDLDPSKNTWFYELALLYFNLDQAKNALKYFIKAADAGYVKSNDYYENLGFAYLYNSDVENGLKNLSIVLSRKPGNSTLLTDIAQALYQGKHYNEALVYYDKLLTLNAGDAKALYMAGITFQKIGKKEKGQAMCDKAIAMDPSLAEKRQKKGEQFGL